MEIFKKWSAVICIACVICTLIELLIPRGRMQKTMQIVINLFIICLASGSFKQSLGELKISLKNFSNSSKLRPDAQLIKKLDLQITNLTAESVKSIISTKLRNINVMPKKIEIFMDTNSDNCIVMIRCRIYLENKYKSLKSQIYEEVVNGLNISAEIVDV